MKNGNKRNGDRRISLRPLSLEGALAAALQVGPPPDKPRRGAGSDQKRVERATKTAIGIYEEALKELEKH